MEAATEAEARMLPRHVVLAALRKQVTGDSDVRIRDFVSSPSLRASINSSLEGGEIGQFDLLRFQLVAEDHTVDLRAEGHEEKSAWINALAPMVSDESLQSSKQGASGNA